MQIKLENKLNEWIRVEESIFFKETETEYVLISAILLVSIDKNKHIYGPSIHRFDKSKFTLKDFDDFGNCMFGEKSRDISLYQKMIFMSAFTECCEDMVDSNGDRISFTFGDEKRKASYEELGDKFLSLIAEFNL